MPTNNRFSPGDILPFIIVDGERIGPCRVVYIPERGDFCNVAVPNGDATVNIYRCWYEDDDTICGERLE